MCMVWFCGRCAGLLDHVTVLIGIAMNGEAVAGVIHQPYFNYQSEEPGIELGRTIWGIVGLGQCCLRLISISGFLYVIRSPFCCPAYFIYY